MTPDSQAERHHSFAASHHNGNFADGPWLITIAVMLSTFMEVLDSTVVNVSLTHIAGSLSATTSEATWVLTSYLVANAVVLPLSGWFSDRIGRKRFYMSCVALFSVSSLLCGLAPSNSNGPSDMPKRSSRLATRLEPLRCMQRMTTSVRPA